MLDESNEANKPGNDQGNNQQYKLNENISSVNLQKHCNNNINDIENLNTDIKNSIIQKANKQNLLDNLSSDTLTDLMETLLLSLMTDNNLDNFKKDEIGHERLNKIIKIKKPIMKYISQILPLSEIIKNKGINYNAYKYQENLNQDYKNENPHFQDDYSTMKKLEIYDIPKEREECIIKNFFEKNILCNDDIEKGLLHRLEYMLSSKQKILI